MIELPKELIKEVQILSSTVRYSDIPSKNSLDKNTAIFFIAGQKSPLERFFPMSEYFAQFYHTYGYEIPGMGVAKRNPGAPATIKSLGDEIAVFLDTVVKEKNIIIVAASAGFWFTTEALLASSKVQKRVQKIISVVGLLGKDTFGFSKLKKLFILAFCKVIVTDPGSKFVNWALSKELLVSIYTKYMIKKRHLSHLPVETQQEFVEFEKFLLHSGDWKIHFSTVAQYLTKFGPSGKLTIPMLAFYSPHDQFFPLKNQQKMFSQVYTSIEWEKITLKGHAPLVVKDFKDYKKVFSEERILGFLNAK
ncbi:alpha/beta hydrolase [bacterium]|nr:alpha/beta hydrolase [bacterium]